MTNLDYRENYLFLAEAVVISAARDYKRLTKLAQRRPLSVFEQSDLLRLRMFFNSKWFGSLTRGLDGREIMQKIEKSCVLDRRSYRKERK